MPITRVHDILNLLSLYEISNSNNAVSALLLTLMLYATVIFTTHRVKFEREKGMK